MRSSIRFSLFLCCLALLVSVPLMIPTTSQAMFSITIYFGQRPSCSGFGLCRIDIGAAREASKGGEAERAAPRGEASASVEPDKTAKETSHLYLKIEMRTALPEKASVMPLTENLTLDAATSKALGHKSITVLKGDYKIDYSKNKFGSLLLKIEARD